MQYDPSLLICRSVTTSLCARSLLFISSPESSLDLTLNKATLPDSCPVMMTFETGVNEQTVAFEPIGLKIWRGSSDSAKRDYISKKVQCASQKRTFCAVIIPVNFEDSDGTRVAHPLLSNTHHLTSIVLKRYTFHGRWELPCKEASSSLDVPESEGVVSRAGNHIFSLCCNPKRL